MNISVFCASTQPRNPRFAEAAAALGRGIALGGRFSARKSTPHLCAVKMHE